MQRQRRVDPQSYLIYHCVLSHGTSIFISSLPVLVYMKLLKNGLTRVKRILRAVNIFQKKTIEVYMTLYPIHKSTTWKMLTAVPQRPGILRHTRSLQKIKQKRPRLDWQQKRLCWKPGSGRLPCSWVGTKTTNLKLGSSQPANDFNVLVLAARPQLSIIKLRINLERSLASWW